MLKCQQSLTLNINDQDKFHVDLSLKNVLAFNKCLVQAAGAQFDLRLCCSHMTNAVFFITSSFYRSMSCDF